MATYIFCPYGASMLSMTSRSSYTYTCYKQYIGDTGGCYTSSDTGVMSQNPGVKLTYGIK